MDLYQCGEDSLCKWQVVPTPHEAYYIDHAMVIPYRATGGIYNGTKLNPFEGVYSSCGWGYLKYKGLYVYDTAMSGDMFSSQLASWEAARGE